MEAKKSLHKWFTDSESFACWTSYVYVAYLFIYERNSETNDAVRDQLEFMKTHFANHLQSNFDKRVSYDGNVIGKLNGK